MKTTGIPAEYRRRARRRHQRRHASRVATSSHGEVHYYLGGSSLQAGPPKRLAADPFNEKTVKYVQDTKQPESHHEVGGTFGGPIARDRLFFFVSVAPGLHRRANDYLFSSGRDNGRISRTSRFIQAFAKLSLSTGPVTSHVSALAVHGDVVGSLPMYNGFGTNWISSSRAANEPNTTRGWRAEAGRTRRHVRMWS